MKVDDLKKLHSHGRAAQKIVKPKTKPKHGSAVGDAIRAGLDAAAIDELTRAVLRETTDRALAPFEVEPPKDETVSAWARRVAMCGVSLLAFPGDLAAAGIAGATAGLGKAIELPAATLGTMHLGIPHTHAHPPAMPGPLPSVGPLILGGCLSVQIGGVPAARAGDLGLAISCGSLSPLFQVITGSSKVLFGGTRAARVGDLTRHCGSGEFEVGTISRSTVIIEGVKAALGAGTSRVSRREAQASWDAAKQHAAAAEASGSPEEAADSQALAQSAREAAAGHLVQASLRAQQTAMDAAAGLASKMVGKDPGAPPCYGALLGGAGTVVIGGFPVPPLLSAFGGLFKLIGGLVAKIRQAGVIARLRAWLAGRLPNKARLRTMIDRASCFLTGHPVDVITGRVLTDAVEFELPGPIPLRFERNYDSAWSGRESPLGFGWSHSLDQAAWTEPGQLVIRVEDGRELEIALPAGVQEAAIAVFDRRHRLTVRGLGEGRWSVRGADGLVRLFAPVTGDAEVVARLVEIREPAGAAIRLEYDEGGRLAWVQDSGGRRVRLVHDEGGRLVQILLPHPDHEGLTGHAEFVYDAAGDLVRAIDALGHAAEFAYDEHRLVRETLRGGLSFRFEYEGSGAQARCVRTWGDGGIYDHRLVYDAARGATVVTNSCGETAVYRAGAGGAVREVVDPRGGVSRYEHDEFGRKTAEIDPLGRVTRLEYDDRGNCTGVVGPDGAAIAVTYDATDRPVAATDALGGRWSWRYDACERVVAASDPLGQVTEYHHSGCLPAGLVDPAGRALQLVHDAAANLVRVELPGGARYERRHDRRGRLRETVDVAGSTERIEYDLLDRVVRVTGADGSSRSHEYDAAGDLVRVRDGARDVVMTYTGLRRLASRSEGGTTVGFAYDTEGRLRAVTHELGAVYRFELDRAGDLAAEYGFEGLRRLYGRDAAGRIVEVHRPGGLRTSYEYDAAGAIVGVAHSDGSGDRFVYRADGELIEARHREPGEPEVVVRIERDLLGRVVREWQGEHWVASRRGPGGLRTEVRSSLGAWQAIARDAAGDVTGIEAEGWSAGFVRDARGLELERRLPGGLRSLWQRDALGRPVVHALERAPRARLDGAAAGLPSHALRRVAMTWDADLQLRRLDDAGRGVTELEHDARGFLVATRRAGAAPTLRLVDALGNLFRRTDRADRRYGPAGELLEADGCAYAYDPEGNLAQKTCADGAVWRYRWSASGTLVAVVRPDGEVVRFAYDALGRRVLKVFRGRKTRWLWDGDVPLHEWTCALAVDDPAPIAADETSGPAEEAGRRAAHPANGPPVEVLTWVFEPEGFTPLARLSSRTRRGISVVADHLGTPVAMFDARGEAVWSAELDAFGAVERWSGERGLCPFRFPGQYEDEETGLHYNRFRYYDPAAGLYVAQDPLGLLAGTRLYGYVRDPSRATDVLGLEEDCVTFYHKADSWASARAVLRGIDLARGGANLDFNPGGRRGFYVTASLRQARRWKTRSSAIVVFKVPRSELTWLKGKVFREPTSEWETFVRAGRSGKLRHDYDFVEGPLLLNPHQPARPAWARGHQVAIFSDEAVKVFNKCRAWII